MVRGGEGTEIHRERSGHDREHTVASCVNSDGTTAFGDRGQTSTASRLTQEKVKALFFIFTLSRHAQEGYKLGDL